MEESKLHIVLRYNPPNGKASEFIMQADSFDAFEKKLSEVRLSSIIKDYDIYIGWWGIQDTYHLKPSLLKAIAETSLEVILDIND
jgi:uncharacterized protein YutD